ncbi:MAG: DUF1573 domain-containing protein [Lentisphaerae bacterium]|nr:DUF1573 domain-containing protein [Lentisphaerota bacterium]
MAGLPAARYFFAAGVLSNALYAMGGYSGGGKTNVYRFDGATWTEVAGLPAQQYAMAGGVLSNTLYSIAGNIGVVQTNVYRFNGTTWTEVAGLPAQRAYPAAGTLNGALYAIGGAVSGTARTNVYRYNGATWSEVASLPAPRQLLGAGVLNSALYAVGGRDSANTAQTNVYRFDGTNWTEVAGLPAARGGLTVAVLNNALYAVGGDESGIKTNVYRYNGTNWTEVAGLPVARWALAADELNGSLYAVAGDSTGGGATQTNVYRYNEELGLRVLGTNAVAIINGETASSAKGTDFGAVPRGLIRTNVFSLINTGAAPLIISAVLTNGAGAAAFQALNVAGQIESDATSTFSVVFAPASLLTYTAQVSIVNNGAQNPYILNVAGIGSKYDQAITFPAIADQTFTSTVGLSASASSGLPVTFAVASGQATISGQTNLSFTGIGSVSITASLAGDTNWNAAPTVTNTFNVAKASQAIAFPAISDQIITSTVGLSATASSGLPVSFAVGSGAGLITDGTNLSFTDTGMVSIVAIQTGNTNWNAASPVTNTFNVVAAIMGILNSDFDGDGKADPAVYNVYTGTWSIKLSTGGYVAMTFDGLLGGSGGAPAAADYDGDGLSDPAVYQEATGNWMILQSGSSYARLDRIAFLGGPGWAPASADYEGDRKADYTVYQETNGSWKVRLSSSAYNEFQVNSFLGSAGYSAASADYDGDRLADPAVYNRTNGTWIFLLSSWNYVVPVTLTEFLGGAGWLPVPADYDGDGKADPAVVQLATGDWAILISSGGYVQVDLENFLGGL